jgi:hypothetical protein
MGVTLRTSAMLEPRNRPSPSVPPLLAEILADELWYGDEGPTWKGAPSPEQAVRKRLANVKRLRRFAATLRSAKSLADRLAACRPDQRCLSGACPECSRAFQRWFVNSAKYLTQDHDSHRELVTASIVFPKGRVPWHLVNTLSVENSKRAVTRSVEDCADVVWMVGGIDISLNDDRQKSLGMGWQLQLYAIAMVKDRIAFASVLKGRFQRTAKVSRPTQIKTCDGSARAISYAFKTDFVRRIAYQGQTTTNGKNRECWMTRKVSLPPVDHADLLVWLHSIGLAQRLYLRGVRMTRNHNGVALAKVKKLE